MTQEGARPPRRIEVGKGRTGSGAETECIRCMSCEAICSFSKERMVNPILSRIRIETKELEWIEGKSKRLVEATVCHQCWPTAECLEACPVEGAMLRDPEHGAVMINETECIRCGQCVDACPFGALWYIKELDRVIKCDLCQGAPRCVEWCPVGVLKLSGGEEVSDE